MSFDEVQIPLRIGFGSSGGPSFSTTITTVDGGFERRNQNWSQARRRYDAATGLRSAADVSALMAFFQARAGRARGFRLKDWNDFSSASDSLAAPVFNQQNIGTGNGTLTQFQLIKTYASGGINHVRSIRKPITGSVLVGVNGAQMMSGWNVDSTTGMITFAIAPAMSAAITAGFQFDVPVRFDTDTLHLSHEDFLRVSSSIPLIEVRV
jgi:uncharacterized protein (TIGR02217 family)